MLTHLTSSHSLPETAEHARACFAAIQQWPHWPEIGLGARKAYGLSSEEFDALLPHYQRFLALCCVYHNIGMLSERVDQLWHCHILNTRLYRAFCQEFAGHPIDHLPCSSFVLFGVAEQDLAQQQCQKPPETCYGPDPAPPDPSPVPPEDRIRRQILEASERFRLAYRASFGEEPSLVIWERLALPRLVEGVVLSS